MILHLKQCSILDIPADVLVCSANGSLHLTGGVGADLMARYGAGMQDELHALLARRQERFARRGEVFVHRMDGVPYLAILHAVAIDAFYESSAPVITDVVTQSLTIAAELDAKSVALAALATGFGNLTLADFAEGVAPVLALDVAPVEDIYISLIHDYRFEELKEAFKGLGMEFELD